MHSPLPLPQERQFDLRHCLLSSVSVPAQGRDPPCLVPRSVELLVPDAEGEHAFAFLRSYRALRKAFEDLDGAINLAPSQQGPDLRSGLFLGKGRIRWWMGRRGIDMIARNARRFRLRIPSQRNRDTHNGSQSRHRAEGNIPWVVAPRAPTARSALQRRSSPHASHLPRRLARPSARSAADFMSCWAAPDGRGRPLATLRHAGGPDKHPRAPGKSGHLQASRRGTTALRGASGRSSTRTAISRNRSARGLTCREEVAAAAHTRRRLPPAHRSASLPATRGSIALHDSPTSPSRLAAPVWWQRRCS